MNEIRTYSRPRARVGMIGAGGISTVHAEAWAAIGAEVSVFAKEGAERLAREFGFSVARTREELFEAVDVVDVVTPTVSHGEVSLAAVAAGKHVICEKPLAMDLDEARRVVRAARAQKVRLFPGHVVRYFPEYFEMRTRVVEGVIGRPVILKLRRGGGSPRPGSWFHDESQGGGIIRDLMIHDMDQALWLAGDVTCIYAVQSVRGRDVHSPDAVLANAVLTHATGAISHLQGVWGADGMPFFMEAGIAGSDGALSTGGVSAPTELRIPGMSASGAYLPAPEHLESPFTKQLRGFLNAIETGEQARSNELDGLRALALVDAARRSLLSGKPEAVDLDALTALGADLENDLEN